MSQEIRITWKPEELPPDLPIRQVYGYFHTEGGLILVQDDKGRRNLPGGRPEGNETLLETLAREAMEESQIVGTDFQYLGYVLVENDKQRTTSAYAQVRFLARLESILPVCIDPATGRCYDRILCPPRLLMQCLNWSGHEEQFAVVCRALESRLNRPVESMGTSIQPFGWQET